MSQVQIAKLKGINNADLNWDTIPFPFTTAILLHDFLQEYNSYVRAYRVINEDGVNLLTYRQDSRTKQSITLDPASIDNQEGWTSLIEVTPNSVTGRGVLEVDLVPRVLAELRVNARR